MEPNSQQSEPGESAEQFYWDIFKDHTFAINEGTFRFAEAYARARFQEREREFERGYASGQAAWEDAHTESCDAALAERDTRIQRLREAHGWIVNQVLACPMEHRTELEDILMERAEAALKEDSK